MSTTEAKLKVVNHSRKYMRAKVTKIYNERDQFSDLDNLGKSATIMKLNDLLSNLKSSDAYISQLAFENDNYDEQKLDEEMEACEKYMDRIQCCLCILATPPAVELQSADPQQQCRSLLKSPTAPLPEFSSMDGENLELFFTNFEETISKYSYSDYDKFLLVKQQIKGKASLLIDSLDPDKQTYKEAKDLLMCAFATTSVQKFNTIKLLSNMKLGYGDEPFQYISDIKRIQQSIVKLKIDMNDVMQYFFLYGLNESFRTQLIHITNNIRPTLDEITDNFFIANERYQVAQNAYKSKKSHDTYDKSKASYSNTYAISVECDPISSNTMKINPFEQCTLCYKPGMNVNHAINKCTNYVYNIDKINRLNELKACIRCANLDHGIESCKFRFKNSCFKCKKWHFSFLCSDETNDTIRTTSQNSMVYGNVFHGSLNIDSILPTFTCLLSDGQVIRGLKDSGSQSNLVAESILNKFNHQVIADNIDLDLSGINDSKMYKVKLVRLRLEFGEETKVIEALTLPNIKISLNLPGLSVIVKKFKELGYKFADSRLLNYKDSIEGLELILGSNAAFCFVDKTIQFGKFGTSIFSISQLGVMLLGNIKQLSEDLLYVPDYDKLNDYNYMSKSNDLYVSSDTAGQITNVKMGCSLGSCSLSVNSQVEIDLNSSYFSDKIDKALELSLEDECNILLCKNEEICDSMDSELNHKLIKYLCDYSTRKQDGRMVCPLLWNGRVNHLLSGNMNLAKKVLESNRDKLVKNNEVTLVDESFRELESKGFIEKISDIDDYLVKFPKFSFLAHMPIIKLQRASTKCRIVFLSNLCESNKFNSNAISHNQAMFSGPCLNQKLTTSLMLLRFDAKLLIFDLKKAFLQIELSELDQSKLLFYWYKNPTKGDFSLQAYKNVRLSFGLRCSPTILMVTLYRILILDTEGDSPELRELKTLLYTLIYVDNGAVTSNCSDKLIWAYNQLNFIFNPYQFELQQFCSNDKLLNDKYLSEPETRPSVELFGLLWDKDRDVLYAKKKKLNIEANTKRLILKSIAENFDPYNFDGPILNRARLFMHDLQMQKSLNWDDTISCVQIKEWRNITKQVNAAEPMIVPRFVGRRASKYKLIAFVDSSKVIYGTTVYIFDEETKSLNFLLAKNRMIGRNLEGKSIPSLELLSISLGAEVLSQLRDELCNPLCLVPVEITELLIYSDSLVALSWIKSYFVSLNKMNKQSVYIMNRLETLKQLCDIFPINFKFVEGLINPADCITRPLSYRNLTRSNYITGPEFLRDPSKNLVAEDLFHIKVPHFPGGILVQCSNSFTNVAEDVVDVTRFSTLSRSVGVLSKVLLFIDKLKRRLSLEEVDSISDLKGRALKHLIIREQNNYFSDIFEYYADINSKQKDMPPLVKQLNVFIDKFDVLRVGSKMIKYNSYKNSHCPILIPKESFLTTLIIREVHNNLNHSGIYTCLTALRREYWIPNHFSVVKKVLKNCVHCHRFNERTVKLNQSGYKEYRLQPNETPFANCFIDYIGPFKVKINSSKEKVWILCITCIYTRAVNLKISLDMTTTEFLRSFNLHCLEYGVPQKVFSDSGSNLISGANVISEFLMDAEVLAHFRENNADITTFEQFYKGQSQLGSLVESIVKITKRLIFGSIKNNVIGLRDFECLVAEVVSLANKRPVAFLESLRDDSVDVPEVITPELLLHGYNLNSINIVPQFHQDSTEEYEWRPPNANKCADIRDSYAKLRIVRNNLKSLYNEEYIIKLIHQATDKSDRYKPVNHKRLNVGDIVLLKEDNCKLSKYPMARIKEVQVNDLGESTGATLFKGNGEIVKRHASSLIPILFCDENFSNSNSVEVEKDSLVGDASKLLRPARQAALKSREITRSMISK